MTKEEQKIEEFGEDEYAEIPEDVLDKSDLEELKEVEKEVEKDKQIKLRM